MATPCKWKHQFLGYIHRSAGRRLRVRLISGKLTVIPQRYVKAAPIPQTRPIARRFEYAFVNEDIAQAHSVGRPIPLVANSRQLNVGRVGSLRIASGSFRFFSLRMLSPFRVSVKVRSPLPALAPRGALVFRWPTFEKQPLEELMAKLPSLQVQTL
jgi:hypothetical protein